MKRLVLVGKGLILVIGALLTLNLIGVLVLLALKIGLLQGLWHFLFEVDNNIIAYKCILLYTIKL